ncbi:MAG: hypothetical protein IJT30_10980 [Muribaculaceae bacterium]|nr:hypothetical protein [Muribaculaceae bacterium]
MKRKDKAYWSAWVLLLVFVPMVLLSSVHFHAALNDSGAACPECLKHAVHKGHLMTHSAHVDCPLCAFQNNVYQAADEQPPTVSPVFTRLTQVCAVPALALGATTNQKNRAPPFTFCD